MVTTMTLGPEGDYQMFVDDGYESHFRDDSGPYDQPPARTGPEIPTTDACTARG